MTLPAEPAPSVWAKYRKAVAVVGVTVAAFVSSVLTDGITVQEWILITGVGVNSILVAVVPNLDVGIAAQAKTVAAGILAGLTVLATVVLGGLTTAEFVEVLLAGAAAVGVTALPNAWPPARLPRSGIVLPPGS